MQLARKKVAATPRRLRQPHRMVKGKVKGDEGVAGTSMRRGVAATFM